MSRVFGPDFRLMQVLHRFAALVVPNFLFLCSCIPFFTIGAALTAMYDVVFRMDTNLETNVPTPISGLSGNTSRTARPSGYCFFCS